MFHLHIGTIRIVLIEKCQQKRFWERKLVCVDNMLKYLVKCAWLRESVLRTFEGSQKPTPTYQVCSLVSYRKTSHVMHTLHSYPKNEKNINNLYVVNSNINLKYYGNEFIYFQNGWLYMTGQYHTNSRRKWVWAFDSYWLLEKMTWNIKINKLWLSMPNQRLLIVKAARHIEKFHVLSSGSFAAYPIKHCTTLQYCGKKKANYYWVLYSAIEQKTRYWIFIDWPTSHALCLERESNLIIKD